MTALAGLADAVRQELGQDKLNDSIWQRTKRLFQSKVELKPKLIAPSVTRGPRLKSRPRSRKTRISARS
jgi:hypothetical protein